MPVRMAVLFLLLGSGSELYAAEPQADLERVEPEDDDHEDDDHEDDGSAGA